MALSRAVVPEEVATQYFARIRSANTVSNSFTLVPLPRPHLPERKTSSSACSSRSSHLGQSVAPRAAAAVAARFAGLSAPAAGLRLRQRPAPAVAALPRKVRRETGAFFMGGRVVGPA
jgi:hypothetical protein